MGRIADSLEAGLLTARAGRTGEAKGALERLLRTTRPRQTWASRHDSAIRGTMERLSKARRPSNIVLGQTTTMASVFLVDDHALVRAGFRRILEDSDEFEVIGEAGNAATAVAEITRLKPRIVLMDISLPDGSGIEATRTLHEVLPECLIVMLSQYDRVHFVEDALRAGASGYLLKTADAGELRTGLLSVLDGNRSLSPEVANRLVRGIAGSDEARLTKRESEVLKLVADGLSSKEIAVSLDISPRTAETHRANLMNKLNVGSVAELVRLAIREGFVPP